MGKLAILGIDLQNDFTEPTGSLYVAGADKDVDRIVHFIDHNRDEIDYIALSLDSHQPVHIAHQCYWQDAEGNPPPLFSTIMLHDVLSGRWIAQYNSDQAIAYIEQLEAKGEVCTIWPMHCILGTNGWALDDKLTKSMANWAIATGRSYELFYKGYAKNTEHYSIFRAAVEWVDQPETKLNQHLLDILNAFDKVILVGEAADFCVSNSLNDILIESPDLAKKIVVFTDCMSWIVAENTKALAIYTKAKDRGVTFCKSVDYSFD